MKEGLAKQGQVYEEQVLHGWPRLAQKVEHEGYLLTDV